MAQRQPVPEVPQDPTLDEAQRRAPYLDALIEYAARKPARLHVPGHKGGPGADKQLAEAIGEKALALDIPSLTWGIDVGVEPNPFNESQRLPPAAPGGPPRPVS